MNTLESEKIPDICEKIKNGNFEAFKTFFMLMQPGIYRFVYRFTLDKDASEDLVQETFIKFWLSRDKLNINLSPKAYLYKIARNLAFNFISRKPPVSSLDSNENLYLYNNTSMQVQYEDEETLSNIRNEINKLPKRCRATFILCKYEGYEYIEIAEIMNTSVQTVKNQMNKALSILRKKFLSQPH